jgi:hypothetical protein
MEQDPTCPIRRAHPFPPAEPPEADSIGRCRRRDEHLAANPKRSSATRPADRDVVDRPARVEGGGPRGGNASSSAGSARDT